MNEITAYQLIDLVRYLEQRSTEFKNREDNHQHRRQWKINGHWIGIQSNKSDGTLKISCSNSARIDLIDAMCNIDRADLRGSVLPNGSSDGWGYTLKLTTNY